MPEATQTAPAPVEPTPAPTAPKFFRATQYGITDGQSHHVNEVFVATPTMLAHYERTGGVNEVLGRTLYVPATETEYVEQERDRRDAEAQINQHAATVGPSTQQVTTNIGMQQMPTDVQPASTGAPLL